jgi:hypothetical protein
MALIDKNNVVYSTFAEPTASGTAPAVQSPGSSKSSSSAAAAAAIRSPVSAFAIVVAATLLSHCLL